jgi:hypothetical protein
MNFPIVPREPKAKLLKVDWGGGGGGRDDMHPMRKVTTILETGTLDFRQQFLSSYNALWK